MRTLRVARRLGLDGNPMRRHTDKIAVCLAALLVAVFLVGAPLLSVAAIGWAGRAEAGGQQPAHSWHQVPAVPLRAASAPAAGQVLGYSLTPARWSASGGQARTGQIPVSAGLAAGRTVPLWIDAAGSPTGPPPPSHRAVVADEAAAAAGATAAVAIVLLCLAWTGRRVLDRRRLAGWEAGWAAVGPQWAKRFRPRG
jgi:hypothetical protein